MMVREPITKYGNASEAESFKVILAPMVENAIPTQNKNSATKIELQGREKKKVITS